MFNCSSVTRLHNITEPATCRYTIWMDTPLACFRGAMQGKPGVSLHGAVLTQPIFHQPVYHVLSAEQLQRWDTIHTDYSHGDITEQVALPGAQGHS